MVCQLTRKPRVLSFGLFSILSYINTSSINTSTIHESAALHGQTIAEVHRSLAHILRLLQKCPFSPNIDIAGLTSSFVYPFVSSLKPWSLVRRQGASSFKFSLRVLSVCVCVFFFPEYWPVSDRRAKPERREETNRSTKTHIHTNHLIQICQGA